MRLWLALVFSCNCFAQEPAIELFERQAKLYMEQAKVPGMAIAVTYQGQTVYANGFGYQDKKPITADTLFRLASNTKMLTAIAIMQLKERNLIDIEAPVTRYLPWFKLKDPSYARITVRQLMNHTSGISRCEGSDIWSNDPFFSTGRLPSSKEMIPGALRQEMLTEPGTRLKYSNLGYWLLGQIIAAYGGAEGHTADEQLIHYFHENILKPLGMDASGFILEPLQMAQLAKPYGAKDTASRERPDAPLVIHPAGSTASGGLYSNANDTCKFLIWLAEAHSGKETPLLSVGSLQTMVSHPIQDPNSIHQYGLGFMIQTGPSGTTIGHGGAFPGHMSSIKLHIETGIGIAIFLNCEDENPTKYWNLAFQTIGNALQHLPPNVPEETESPSIKPPSPKGKFKQIAGHYQQPFLWEFDIYENETGNLICSVFGNQLSMRLVEQSERRIDFIFGWEGSFLSFNGERITFFLDSQGQVEYCVIGNTFYSYRVISSLT